MEKDAGRSKQKGNTDIPKMQNKKNTNNNSTLANMNENKFIEKYWLGILN